MSCSKVYWDNLYKKLKPKDETISEQNEKQNKNQNLAIRKKI